ncbi:hypothetical protein N665_0439s0031 [Sinapis alba]|nr:hypothetical protein N665_0439s0031 [Sinapis alba]
MRFNGESVAGWYKRQRVRKKGREDDDMYMVVKIMMVSEINVYQHV